MSAGGVSAPPWLAAIEAKLRETDLCHECQADCVALLIAVKALRAALVPTDAEFIDLGTRAVDGYLDFTVARAWFVGRAAAVLGTFDHQGGERPAP